MLSPLIVSIIRTGVPALVGALAAWLLAIGLDVPDELLGEAVAVLSAVATVGYYVLARVVERRWPSLSWLLGSGQQPAAYATPHADGSTSVGVDPAVLPLDEDD